MPTGLDSRHGNLQVIAIVDSVGNQVENLRLDIPYPRPAATQVSRPDLTRYTVRGDDSWRTLGHRFFQGQPHLWWAIAEFTGVIDPFMELAPGKTVPGADGALLVPSLDLVMFDLLNT